MRLRALLIPILLAVGLCACSRRGVRPPDSAPTVALSVRTEPSGARVRVNRLIQTWLTPCDITDPAVTRGMLDIEITLQGYEPVKTFVYYDGEVPAQIDRKLVSLRPAPVAVEPAPPEKPVVVEAPTGTQIKLEPVRGGSRLTVVSPGSRILISARTVVLEADRAGVYFLPNVPPEQAAVQLLDAATGAVLQTFMIAPNAALPPSPR